MRTSSTQPELGTPLNRSHQLTKGLVGFWLLNEGGGTHSQDSTRIQRIDGTVSGAAWVKSHRGNSVLFSGSTHSVMVPDFYAGSLARTYSFWIMMTSLPSAGLLVAAIGKRYSASGEMAIYINDTGKARFLLYGTAGPGTQLFDFTATTGMATGVWTHIAFTYDGSTVRAYFNGSADGTSNVVLGANTIINGPDNYYFGQEGDNTRPLAGALMDIKIYERALSGTEVRQLYNYPYQMFKDSGRYKMPSDLFRKFKFNNRGIRPRPFAPGHAR